MTKLMWIAGILLAAAGVALGLMVFVSPAPIVGWGITPEVAALLLVGGVLSIGLGGVINALEARPAARAGTPVHVTHVEAPTAPIPEFGRRAAEATSVTTVAAQEVVEEVSEPVKETIQALEQARQKIEQAFETKSEVPVAMPEPQPEPVAAKQAAAPETVPEPEPDVAEGETQEEGQLYVVEERFIRGRPARVLSDSTVEAETDEGWMRFENLEHLDEYLDAVAPAVRA